MRAGPLPSGRPEAVSSRTLPSTTRSGYGCPAFARTPRPVVGLDPGEDERGEEAPRVRRAQDAVHLDEDLRRPPSRLDERQEAGLHHRPLDAARVAVPGDVARRDPERPFLVDEELVEVSPGLGREDRLRRDLEPRHVGRVIGEEGHLHPRQEVHLVLDAPLALDPLDEVGRVEPRLVLALGSPGRHDPDPGESREDRCREEHRRDELSGETERREEVAQERGGRRRDEEAGEAERPEGEEEERRLGEREDEGRSPRRVLEGAGVEESVPDRPERVGPLAGENEAEEGRDEDEASPPRTAPRGRRSRCRRRAEGRRTAPPGRPRECPPPRRRRRRGAGGRRRPRRGRARRGSPCPRRGERRPAARASRLVRKPGTVSRSIDSATAQYADESDGHEDPARDDEPRHDAALPLELEERARQDHRGEAEEAEADRDPETEAPPEEEDAEEDDDEEADEAEERDRDGEAAELQRARSGRRRRGPRARARRSASPASARGA